MSLGACIPDLIASGKLTAEEGERMKRLFDQYERHYRRTMSPEAAAAEASTRTLGELVAQAALNKRQTLLSIQARERAAADIARYRYTGKTKSPFAPIRAMLENDVRAPYENIELGAQAIDFDAHSRIADFIQRHRRNFAGVAQDKAGLIDMVREAHGESTGNPRAATFAGAIADTFEALRLRYNAAGGAIGKLDNYFPHQWSTAKVRSASYDAFRAVVLPELDVQRMRDPLTGGELTAERLEEVLRASYDNIRSGGLMGEPSAGFRGAGMLANRRTNSHRFLHFSSADGWLRAHAAFGEGDPFSAVMGHIRGMAMDIAMMERLGPNPDSTMRYLIDAAERGEAQGDTVKSSAALGMSGGRALTENLWRYMKGELNVPIVPESLVQGPPISVTRALGGTRNLLTAALLGSAPLSAIADANTQAMARKFNGLPEVKLLWSYLKQMNPASPRDRQLAIRLGLGMRDASHALLGMSRYYGDMDRAGWTAIVADDVLRVSGLNKFTEAGQRAFGVDFLGTLGERRGSGFEQLPAKLRGALDRYGIDGKAWDAIRSAEPERSGGAEYVSAANVADSRARDRLMQMVLGETQAAVQETKLGVRAIEAAVGRPGTWAREIMANSLQFKGYSASLLLTQGQRMATLRWPNRIGYAAQFFLGMTVFGAAALQLREIAKGRDPRPMFDDAGSAIPNAEFWADAATQGGGIGIFGDLIGSFENDRLGGSGWKDFIAGPMGSFASDAEQAVKTAVPHRLKDETWREGNPGKAAVRLLKRYTPGSNLWYLRAGFEHSVLDQLSAAIDPTYLESEDRVRQWAADNGQGIWWEPGHALPSRAPSVSNALGAQPH